MTAKNKPSWFQDLIAALRAQRKRGEIEPSEFAELAVDQIEDHPEYMRSLARADVLSYDKQLSRDQKAALDDETAFAVASGYIRQSLLPYEMLEKLGLDPDLKLGFGRKVGTLDATHEQRMDAIKELERERDGWIKSKNDDIAAIRNADELAQARTLRQVIDDTPDEYGSAAQ